MRKLIVAIVAGAAIAVSAVLLYSAAFGGSHDPGPATPTVKQVAHSHKPADPYKVYLRLAPHGALHLSRENAQARAFLGCQMHAAPGTVDWALHRAYRDLCASREG